MGNAVSQGLGAPVPRPVFVASAYQAAPGGTNVDLWPGDPVTKLGDGTYQLCTASSGQIDGVIIGIAPYYNSGIGAMAFSDHLPGATTYGTNLDRQSVVYIVDPGLAYFEAICDDATTFTTKATYTAALGENVDCIYVPVAADAKAYPKLDISTHANTGTLQWRIVSLSQRPETDYSGANVPLIVTPNVVGQAPFQVTGVA